MTPTDDELLALCEAYEVSDKWDDLMLVLNRFHAAADPERVKALVMRVREVEGQYGERCAEYQRLDRNFDLLQARLKRAEEALRKIADAPAWGAPDRWETTPTEVRRLAAAYFSNPSENDGTT